MARQFSTRDFFRQMPNRLLARYFQSKGTMANVDFATMAEAKPDALFNAWLALPDDPKNAMDAELRDIHALCDEKGFIAITDEAKWQYGEDQEGLAKFLASMAALPSHYERAMVTFLDHAACWKGATRFHHSDSLSYWRKRKNIPKNPAAVDEASLSRLSQAIQRYFQHTEGRGKNCVVEPFKRGNKDYFFAYPEDHSQHSIEWVDGEFNPRPHNPAFEIVFVYCQQDGTLDLNFRGNTKAIPALQEIFAQEILKAQSLPVDKKDERIYDLSPLAKRGFEFSYSLGSGIEKITVKKIRLSSKVHAGERITVEADSSLDRMAIYALLEDIGKSVPLGLYSVTLVELSALMKGADDKPPKKITFRITYPNSCSLKYEDTDMRLRTMLEASGIEPKIPAVSAVSARGQGNPAQAVPISEVF